MHRNHEWSLRSSPCRVDPGRAPREFTLRQHLPAAPQSNLAKTRAQAQQRQSRRMCCSGSSHQQGGIYIQRHSKNTFAYIYILVTVLPVLHTDFKHTDYIQLPWWCALLCTKYIQVHIQYTAMHDIWNAYELQMRNTIYIWVEGCRGLMVKVLSWQSFGYHFEPYLRTEFLAAPPWCGLGCRSRTDGRIHWSWFLQRPHPVIFTKNTYDPHSGHIWTRLDTYFLFLCAASSLTPFFFCSYLIDIVQVCSDFALKPQGEVQVGCQRERGH